MSNAIDVFVNGTVGQVMNAITLLDFLGQQINYLILLLQDTDKAAWEAMFENPPALLTEVRQFYTRKCTQW